MKKKIELMENLGRDATPSAAKIVGTPTTREDAAQLRNRLLKMIVDNERRRRTQPPNSKV